jgi:hypothetical protein
MENLPPPHLPPRLLRTLAAPGLPNPVYYINNNNELVLLPDIVHISHIHYTYHMDMENVQRYLVYNDNTNRAMWYKLVNGIYVNCLNDGQPWDTDVDVVATQNNNQNINQIKYLKYKNKYINLKKSVF